MIPNNFSTGIQEITNPNLYQINEIKFEQGLLGYENISQFRFMSLEDQGFVPLQLLSAVAPCANDTPLAFIVVDEENAGLDPLPAGPRESIASALKIDSFFEVYYLITLEQTSKMLHFKANVRAPLIIDPVTRKGWQYIFTDAFEEVSCLLQHLSTMIHHNRLRQSMTKA